MIPSIENALCIPEDQLAGVMMILLGAAMAGNDYARAVAMASEQRERDPSSVPAEAGDCIDPVTGKKLGRLFIEWTTMNAAALDLVSRAHRRGKVEAEAAPDLVRSVVSGPVGGRKFDA